MHKRELLSEVEFGQRVAEEEVDDLVRYFVETDHWRRLYSGKADIIYGPKGSGKSALYALLLQRRDELFDRSILLVPAENPRGAPAFKDLVLDPPATQREFVSLWKLYFASLLGGVFEEFEIQGRDALDLRNALEQAGLLPGNRSLRAVLRAVTEYVRGALRPESISVGAELDQYTGLPTGFGGRITFQEPAIPGDDLGFRSVDALLQSADKALSGSKFSVWLLLDRLDVAFSDSSELEENALRALFQVYLDLSATRRVRPKIFLRTDIWRRITSSGFREASHITRSMTIDWNQKSLMKLIVSRAIQNRVLQSYYGITPEQALRSIPSQEKFFSKMCPAQVDLGPNKPKTFDWVLSRTADGTKQNAPRELIHLFNSLREKQIRRLEVGEAEPEGENLFVRPAFKEALQPVSKVRLEQTLFAEYPDLKPYLEALRGQKTLHTRSTLSSVWGCEESEARQAAEQLVEAGFFEMRGTRDRPEYWVPFLYRDALEMVQGRAGA